MRRFFSHFCTQPTLPILCSLCPTDAFQLQAQDHRRFFCRGGRVRYCYGTDPRNQGNHTPSLHHTSPSPFPPSTTPRHHQLVADVSVVLGIAGSIGSTSISFILPPLFILRLSKKRWLSVRKMGALMLMLLGIAFFVISTVITLLDAANPDDADLDIADLCKK